MQSRLKKSAVLVVWDKKISCWATNFSFLFALRASRLPTKSFIKNSKLRIVQGKQNFRVGNCAFLFANANKNCAPATRISRLVNHCYFLIWRLKKKCQSLVGACLKKLISDPEFESFLSQGQTGIQVFVLSPVVLHLYAYKTGDRDITYQRNHRMAQRDVFVFQQLHVSNNVCLWVVSVEYRMGHIFATSLEWTS